MSLLAVLPRRNWFKLLLLATQKVKHIKGLGEGMRNESSLSRLAEGREC